MKISIPTEPQNIFKVIKTSFLIWKHSLIFIAPFNGAFIIAILYSLLAKNRCRCKLEVNAAPLEHSETGNATGDWIF